MSVDLVASPGALPVTSAAPRANAWQRWVALLDTTEAATSLGLVRIASGITVFGHLWNLWRTGAVEYVWVDAAHGGLRKLDSGWPAQFGGLTLENVHAVMAVAMGAALLMSAGVLTRLTTAVSWFTWAYLADLNSHAGGSYDEVIKNTLFLLLLSGAGNALSVDERIRRKLGAGGFGTGPLGRFILGDGGPVTAWPRWLMVGQLVLIYWATALQKVSVSWVPFGELDALWYILQQPTWQRFPLDPAMMLPFYPVTQLMTLSVWCWEQAAPLLLLAFWFRHTRTRGGWLRAQFNRVDFRMLYLLFGVGMHLGIDLLMEVGPFCVATMTLYMAAVHPEEWGRVGRWFRRGR